MLLQMAEIAKKKENTPEMDLCDELGIQMLWGIGGQKKISHNHPHGLLINFWRKNEKKIFVRGPVLSQSGYGEQSRFA